MIRKPNNWNEVKEFTEFVKLPLGAYVCKIRQVAIQNNGYGDQLFILFDIVEGEFAEYFSNEFKNNQNAEKKWKGVLRQWLPKDDGSEKDEWTKSAFKGLITSIEKSNPGYVFDWNENSLVGKKIGVMFRNEEWDYNGKHGWAVRPFKAISVDSVRNGDFRLPADKPLQNKPSAGAFGGYNDYSFAPAPTGNFDVLTDDDSDVPF